MIEYNNGHKVKCLVKALSRYPIDMASPNSINYMSLFKEPILDIIHEIQNILLERNYIIIRDFSVSDIHALSLARLLSNKIFYQGSDLKYIYQFETQPFQTEILSSSLACGSFHTDFWSVSDTPNYILIQCVEPDPRYPYYSRNQITSVSLLLSTLEKVSTGIVQLLLKCSLPHRINENKVIWIKLLEEQEEKYMIRLHPQYVAEDILENEHYFHNIPIHRLISDVAQSICDDFVLNKNDVLIASNKFCLHRRGEATVVFRDNLSEWKGRIVNTLRFF